MEAAEQGIDLAQLGGIQRNLARPGFQETAISQLQALSPDAQIQLARDQVALNRERLELRAMQNPELAVDPEFQADQAKQFRSEKRADLAPYIAGMNRYDNLMAQLQLTGDQGNPAAAYASLMMYLQGWDNSVVRGSEVASFQGGFGPTGQIAALWNQWRGGGFTDDSIRDAMIESIHTHAQSQHQNMQRIRDSHDAQIGRVAQAYGFGEETFLGLTRVPGAEPRQFGEVRQVRGEQPFSSQTITVDGDQYETVQVP